MRDKVNHKTMIQHNKKLQLAGTWQIWRQGWHFWERLRQMRVISYITAVCSADRSTCEYRRYLLRTLQALNLGIMLTVLTAMFFQKVLKIVGAQRLLIYHSSARSDNKASSKDGAWSGRRCFSHREQTSQGDGQGPDCRDLTDSHLLHYGE